MMQYTKFTPTPYGLMIELTNEGKAMSAEWLEDLEAGRVNYGSLWADINEYNFCNGFSDVRPEQIGALTSAPIISDGIIDDETTQDELDKMNVWWFPQYCVRDELRELLTEGAVLFELAP